METFDTLDGEASTYRLGSQTFADVIKEKKWIESPLGKRGVSGGAYLVVDDAGNKYVLKFIRGTSGFAVSYVDSEIKMLMSLIASPYIVNLLAATLYSDKAYILYPYVPGATLDEWLKTHKDVNERSRVYEQLMNGLIDIHTRGYVHRDIKPANIWVPEDPRLTAFYLDLGLTAQIGDDAIEMSTPTYTRVGNDRSQSIVEQNYYALGKIVNDDSSISPELKAVGKVMQQQPFSAENMEEALLAYKPMSNNPRIKSAFAGGYKNLGTLQNMSYTVASSPAPLSSRNTYTSWPGGVDPTASVFSTDTQKGGFLGLNSLFGAKKNAPVLTNVTVTNAPAAANATANATAAASSTPGEPAPISLFGGKRNSSRKTSRKTPKASRKNRKASRKDRKASRKSRKSSRKDRKSRKSSRKDRKASRKSRKSSRKDRKSRKASRKDRKSRKLSRKNRKVNRKNRKVNRKGSRKNNRK
jgi:serine/threonine protein kinase